MLLSWDFCCCSKDKLAASSNSTLLTPPAARLWDHGVETWTVPLKYCHAQPVSLYAVALVESIDMARWKIVGDLNNSHMPSLLGPRLVHREAPLQAGVMGRGCG